jgi:hypothetical protein
MISKRDSTSSVDLIVESTNNMIFCEGHGQYSWEKGSLDSKGIPTAMRGNYRLIINLSRNFRGYREMRGETSVLSRTDLCKKVLKE